MNDCFFCGKRTELERHHVYPAALRKKSEKYGAVVCLCHKHHNEPPDGVHFKAENMRRLQRYFQKKIMQEQGWSMAKWMTEFYKNYLED